MGNKKHTPTESSNSLKRFSSQYYSAFELVSALLFFQKIILHINIKYSRDVNYYVSFFYFLFLIYLIFSLSTSQIITIFLFIYI